MAVAPPIATTSAVSASALLMRLRICWRTPNTVLTGRAQVSSPTCLTPKLLFNAYPTGRLKEETCTRE